MEVTLTNCEIGDEPPIRGHCRLIESQHPSLDFGYIPSNWLGFQSIRRSTSRSFHVLSLAGSIHFDTMQFQSLSLLNWFFLLRIIRSGLVVFCIASSNVSTAQNKSNTIPPKAQVDTVFTNMVNEFNSKMAGTKADERTIIRFMSYDAKVPTLGYFYSTTHYLSTKRKELTNQEKKAMWEFHVRKTCTSSFDIFMKFYGLVVVHRFEDSTTGAKLIEMRIKYSDCT